MQCNKLFIYLIFISVSWKCSYAQFVSGLLNQNQTDVVLQPQNITKLKTGITQAVEWYTTYPDAHHVVYSVLDPIVSTIVGFEDVFAEEDLPENLTGQGTFNVTADFLGFNIINVTIYDKDNNSLGIGQLPMSVILDYQKFNTIFTIILAVFIFIMYINMGATIDLTIVRNIAQRPVGPIVGLVCQYIIMPAIAFGLSVLFFADDTLMQLGFFLNGASPGGGQSNMWTLLLGGSLDLSIMMTFVSTIVAFGAVPLWVLTIGPQIIGENSTIVIPYGNIAILVVALVIPCSIGLAIQRFFPKAAVFLERRILKPFALINLLFIFTVGAYSHRYIFSIFSWKIILASFCLPGLGYLSGLLLATLLKRSWPERIAISIETGVQNANIAILILKVTLGSPAGDLAVVLPSCMFIMTPIPLLVIYLVKKIYGYFAYSDGKDISTTPKEGIDNGMINHITLPDENRNGQVPQFKAQQMNVANGSTSHHANEMDRPNHKAESSFTTRNKLYGVDNRGVDLSNDVL